MLISQDQKEIHAAQAIRNQADLKEITLVNCTAFKHGDESDFQGPFHLAFRNKSIEAKLNGSLLVIQVSFESNGTDSSSSARTMFDINCTFELLYALPDGYVPTQVEIDAFKTGNAVFNCWPYAREFIQSIASRLGFHPPPIPLLRMSPKRNKAKATKQPDAEIVAKPTGRDDKRVTKRRKK